MRSSPASGATMTPTPGIPAGHPPACTSPSSASAWPNGGSGSCATTAQAVAAQVAGLGWHRILLAGQPRVTGPFLQQLPEPASAQVAATVDANLIWEDHAAVAERLDDALRDAALRQARALAGQTVRRAFAGGEAAIGWPEVADSLVQHRVGHLIVGIDAALDPAVLGPRTQAALGWPSPRMLVERAVEQAVIAGAEVTVLPADTPEAGTRRRSRRDPALLTHRRGTSNEKSRVRRAALLPVSAACKATGKRLRATWRGRWHSRKAGGCSRPVGGARCAPIAAALAVAWKASWAVATVGEPMKPVSGAGRSVPATKRAARNGGMPAVRIP